MCGIAGFVDLSKRLQDPKNCLTQMTDSLSYRGPDGQGQWYDAKTGVGLGHRRLAIIDLSSDGHQPMNSASDRYVIVYNGEVYNFSDLRKELEHKGYVFRGHSDTEIILAAIDAWGLDSALTRFIGMFAIALWDKQLRKLYLIRDRLGIKPLYFGYINGAFVFASELKAIRAFPDFNLPIKRDSVALLLRHGYIPAPYSIYQGIEKLEAGHYITLDIKDNNELRCEDKMYWSVINIAEQASTETLIISPEKAVEELEELLSDAIRLRMLADVPLGAFLSGGIDSSLVVALMQQQSERPIQTFSIGFHELQYNEANYAKAIAQHLGTEHTEHYVSPTETLSVIPKLPTMFDEPFADPSQIPTFLVAQLARNHVTVSLSGDGGDELFYGYSRYFYAQRIWKKISLFPPKLRIAFGSALSAVLSGSTGKLKMLSEVLSVQNQDEFYRSFVVSSWKTPTDVVLESNEPLNILSPLKGKTDFGDFPLRMMLIDIISYLPDDILVKVDRASMAVSLEARVPLLDHRVVEFACRLPFEIKYRFGKSKWILRQILQKYVPQDLLDRPKKGFGVPIDAWLRGPLKEWAESLLSEQRLRDEGYFDPNPIRLKWQEHLSGRRDWHYYLWQILMFQSWLEHNK